MLLKCCIQYASKFGKLSSVKLGLQRVSFHSSSKERQHQRMFKCHIIACISHTRKVMLKLFQTRFQQFMNREIPDVQAGFRKGRGTRDQIVNICWIIEKAKAKFQKSPTSASLTTLNLLTVCTTNCENS